MFHVIKGTDARHAPSVPYATREAAVAAADRAIPSGWEWAVVIEVTVEAVATVYRVVRDKEER